MHKKFILTSSKLFGFILLGFFFVTASRATMKGVEDQLDDSRGVPKTCSSTTHSILQKAADETTQKIVQKWGNGWTFMRSRVFPRKNGRLHASMPHVNLAKIFELLAQ